jgi:pimeloyl-ACP methyl ester carboxylesterase
MDNRRHSAKRLFRALLAVVGATVMIMAALVVASPARAAGPYPLEVSVCPGLVGQLCPPKLSGVTVSVYPAIIHTNPTPGYGDFYCSAATTTPTSTAVTTDKPAVVGIDPNAYQWYIVVATSPDTSAYGFDGYGCYQVATDTAQVFSTTITLQYAATNGTVRTSDGNLAVGAKIEVRAREALRHSVGDLLATATTDSTGKFEVWWPVWLDGQYVTLTITPPPGSTDAVTSFDMPFLGMVLLYPWNFNLKATEFTISKVQVQEPVVKAPGTYRDVAGGGTYDGNPLRVTATITNTGAPVDAVVKLDEFDDSRPQMTASTNASIPTGTTDVLLNVDSTGSAWSTGSVPTPDHSLRIKATPTCTQGSTGCPAVATSSANVRVLPAPVVLLHGLWSTAETWHAYEGFVTAVSPDWHAYAVGDGKYPGVMDTGVSPGTMRKINNLDENAAIAAGYIAALRKDLNAWQVDLVAHSMGGLISRSLIQNYMPLFTLSNMPRPVRHLVMLGTPNLGSPCADTASGLLFRSTDVLQTASMARFNQSTTNLRGVVPSILGGIVLPFTCFAKGLSDGVVPLPSAYYNFTDRGTTFELHTDMPGSGQDFATFVKPRLTLTRAAAGATVAEPLRAAKVQPQAVAKTPATDGIGLGTVAAGKTKTFTFNVVRGEKLLVLAFGTGGYKAVLKAPNAKTTTVTGATSGPMGGLSPTPTVGRWSLTVTAGTSLTEYQVVVSGSPIHLTTTATATKAKGTATVSARIAGFKSLPRNTVVSALVTGPDGKARKVVLVDDGKHGDGKARDGVYGAKLSQLKTGRYFIDVSAVGSASQKVTRYDSQSLSIR